MLDRENVSIYLVSQILYLYIIVFWFISYEFDERKCWFHFENQFKLFPKIFPNCFLRFSRIDSLQCHSVSSDYSKTVNVYRKFVMSVKTGINFHTTIISVTCFISS